jgi:hypothetical protein
MEGKCKASELIFSIILISYFVSKPFIVAINEGTTV